MSSEGASAPGSTGARQGCCGGSASNATLDETAGGESPILLLVKDIASAFPALSDAAEGQLREVASALLLTSRAMRRFSAEMRALGADEDRSRQKFCDELATHLEEVERLLHAAGGACCSPQGQAVSEVGLLLLSLALAPVLGLRRVYRVHRDRDDHRNSHRNVHVAVAHAHAAPRASVELRHPDQLLSVDRVSTPRAA